MNNIGFNNILEGVDKVKTGLLGLQSAESSRMAVCKVRTK